MAEYPTPIASVDTVLLVLRDGALCVGLLRREQPPHARALALPGGYIRMQEDADAEDAARRMLRDKAGLDGRFLEQLRTFSGRDRDPRGWSISIAYYALVAEQDLAGAAPGLVVAPVDALPPLPFDHADMVRAAVERLRGKSTYSSLPAYLLPPEFTISELQRVYEQVLGTRLDRASFRRKIQDQRIIEPAAGDRRSGAHRPAQLYRLGGETLRQFPRMI